MPNPDTPKHSTIDLIVDAIAAWVGKYRWTLGDNVGLDRCGPSEVKQIAKELGLSTGELKDIAAKGPGAADQLRKMLLALDVDPEAIMKSDPAVMRDLQRLCVACDHKSRCRHEFMAGTAAAHFREFCPNAFTLDALFAERGPAAQH